MRFQTAVNVLKKESEFLGMKLEKVIEFIEKSPLAFSSRAVEAVKVYKTYKEQ